MTKGYWVNMFRSVKDPEKVEAFRKLAFPLIEAAGGKLLVRGEPTRVYGAGVMQRVVVIEFDSLERAIAMYDSASYQAALKALGDGAEQDLRIVEGVASIPRPGRGL